MIYIRAKQDRGPLFLNAERIVRFSYDTKFDVTYITMTDGSTYTISGNCTTQIVETLKRIEKLSLIQIGD